MMETEQLARFYGRPMDAVLGDPALSTHHEALLDALETGRLRSARRREDGVWEAVTWVRMGILAGFRAGVLAPMPGWGTPSFDRDTYPPRRFRLEEGVRLVPGGSAVRRGAHVAAGVVIMPPAYVNVGAHVGSGTLVDSHALVGSCAQIGCRVHLSAAAQVGGVLEPVGTCPVIVEDDAFIGGLCGLFEGVVVRERAVLAAGVTLTASTPILDLVHERELRGEVPAGAVVVPGGRPAGSAFARERGLTLAAAVVVKYRDARTDAATALEEALR